MEDIEQIFRSIKEEDGLFPEQCSNQICKDMGLGIPLIPGGGGPPCRYSEPYPLCSLCGDKTTPDPTGGDLLFVQVTHILPFVSTVWVTWCLFYRFDILRARLGIWGIFLFSLGICFLNTSSLCEFANHALIMNWNMCYDTSNNIIYAAFYFFNGGGNSLVTLGLRKKGTPWYPWKRWPFRSSDGSDSSASASCDLVWKIGDLISWIADLAMIVMSIAAPFVYMSPQGRVGAFGLFMNTAKLAGTVELFRLILNLDPTWRKVFCGHDVNLGPLAPIMAIVASIGLSISINENMYKTGKQTSHGWLACSFFLNQIFVGITFLIAQKAPNSYSQPTGERTPLVKSDDAA